MKTVRLEIDGKTVHAQEGTTIFEAAKSVGIQIPHMCQHELLEPYGACRLCMVEIVNGTAKKLVASCVYPVKEGLVVETSSQKVLRIRRMILELVWPLSQDLAKQYGITRSRFRTETPDCHLCGICVRYCSEVKKLNVVYFKGRGIEREIALVPGFEKECSSCQECFGSCRGGHIIQRMEQAYQ
jgi:NADH dehydrogenase/NADH:ubiquinone oxidoreductase subunit G